MNELFEWLGILERSSFGEAIRTAPFLYPVLESLHVVGIGLLLGSIFAVDMRLLGAARRLVPVTTVMRCLLPISYFGFVLVVLTGGALFSGIAVAVASSPAAPWKFGLIALAGLNILLFHTGAYRGVSKWDLHAPTPVRAKAASLVSISAWIGTVFAGRFLAYA